MIKTTINLGAKPKKQTITVCAWCGENFLNRFGHAKYCMDHRLPEFRFEREKKK